VQSGRVYQIRFHFDANGSENALGAYIDNIAFGVAAQ